MCTFWLFYANLLKFSFRLSEVCEQFYVHYTVLLPMHIIFYFLIILLLSFTVVLPLKKLVFALTFDSNAEVWVLPILSCELVFLIGLVLKLLASLSFFQCLLKIQLFFNDVTCRLFRRKRSFGEPKLYVAFSDVLIRDFKFRKDLVLIRLEIKIYKLLLFFSVDLKFSCVSYLVNMSNPQFHLFPVKTELEFLHTLTYLA